MVCSVRRLSLIFCLLFIFVQQQISGQYFKVQTYTLQDGLPDAVVYDAVQDSSGMMWFVGRKGIFTYDGIEFNKILYDGIIDEGDSFVKLNKDETNSIWFLPEYASKNIICFKGGKWSKIPSIYNEQNISSFWHFQVEYIKNKPIVVVSTFDDVWGFYDNKWTKYSFIDNKQVSTIYSIESYNDQFYLGTKQGIYTVRNGRIYPWKRLNDSLPNKNIIHLTVLNKDLGDYPNFGILSADWFGIYKGKIFEKLPITFDLPQTTYRMHSFLTFDNRDRLYFGNKIVNFSYSFTNKQILQLDSRNGFTTNGATSAFIDRENNLWVTSLRGINKVSYSPFINYTKTSGLVEDEVATIEIYKNGNIFLGHNNGFSILNKEKIHSQKLEKTANEIGVFNRILDADTDREGDLWVASGQKGLGKLEEKELNFQWYKAPPRKELNTLVFDNKNRLLVGTVKGVFKFNEGSFVRLKEYEILNEVFVRKMVKDSSGNILICTNMYGVYKYNGEKFSHFRGGNEKVDNVFCANLINDKILVGTLAGLYIAENKVLKKFESNGFKIDHPVYFIINDNDGNIWFGLDNGVIKWNGSDWKHYSVEDGLAGYETNRSAAVIDDMGRLWFGTNKGLSVYLKEYDELNLPKPKLELLSLEDLEGVKYRIDQPLILENNHNNFTVHFRAFTFINEKTTKYHINIIDLNDSKIDSFITVERWARFSNISPGDYKLQIQAENVRGVFSDLKSSSIITIQQPYYMQFWFLAMVLIFFGFISFNIFKYYNQKRRSEELERMVKERTKALEDSQKQLIESEKRYKGLIESQSEMIVRVDNQNRFTFVNDAYCKVFGKSPDEIIGKTFIPLIHPDDRKKTLDIMKDLDKPPYRIYVEQRALTKSGWRWLSWEDYAIKDENGVTVEIQAIGRDITDKMFADRIRTHAIFEAIEKERSRISRDLHDDLGQILTGAKLKLEIVKKNSPTVQSEPYQDAVEMIGSVGKHLRNIVHDLHPTEIARYGLFPALESLCFQMQKISGIKIYYDYADFKGKWDNKHDLMIYRIVQESLNNVIKHSKSKTAKVYFSGNNTEVHFEVEDEGVGFDTGKLHSIKNIGSGFGLINIQQRVELIGGRMNIVSEIGRGTKLIVNIIREPQSE